MSDPEIAETLPRLSELPAGLRVLPGGQSVVRRQSEEHPFLDIEFPRRAWADSEYGLRYHVYSSPGERVSVAARSVIEAIIAAGIERPFKIERGTAVEEIRAVVVAAGRLVSEDFAAEAPPETAAEAPAEPDHDASPEDTADAAPQGDGDGDGDDEPAPDETDDPETDDPETD